MEAVPDWVICLVPPHLRWVSVSTRLIILSLNNYYLPWTLLYCFRYMEAYGSWESGIYQTFMIYELPCCIEYPNIYCLSQRYLPLHAIIIYFVISLYFFRYYSGKRCDIRLIWVADTQYFPEWIAYNKLIITLYYSFLFLLLPILEYYFIHLDIHGGEGVYLR